MTSKEKIINIIDEIIELKIKLVNGEDVISQLDSLGEMLSCECINYED